MALVQYKQESLDSAIKMEITPEMADTWIRQSQTRNRKIRPLHVQQLASMMRAGSWECNGETIIFDNNNNILDGHHRLFAVVLAKVPIISYVVYGITPAMFHTIDQGMKRTAAHVFGLKNEPNSAALAASLRWLYYFEMGIKDYKNPNIYPTIFQLEDLLRAHPDFRMSLVWRTPIRAILPSSLGIALHYLFACRDRQRADLFFHQLATGVDLSPTDPTHILRERLIRDKSSKAKLPMLEKAALFILAWNAFRTGRILKQLKWTHQGPSVQPFPVIL